MSRKKQAEKYKILYTPWILTGYLNETFRYRWNVCRAIGPPINDYLPLAGFDDINEAKAYRRKKIKEEN